MTEDSRTEKNRTMEHEGRRPYPRELLQEIWQERLRQMLKWGKGDDVNASIHDDSWTALDWHEMIADYNGWARRMAVMGSWDKARERYIQVAALALAAVQAIDRATKGSSTT